MSAAAPGSAPWPVEWLASTAAQRSGTYWRGVEAQHIVATMRLVDSLEEQAVLERLLEDSKPPLPAAAPSLSPARSPARSPSSASTEAPSSMPPSTDSPPHYLLATPFRYRSPFASRFRRPYQPGVWYGAQTLKAAAAEVAYWRWRFLVGSSGLADSELHTEHTFFQAQVQGLAIDLSLPPWNEKADWWTRDRDYSHTHELADAARAAGLHWLRYASVREVGGHCAAVFTDRALCLQRPHAPQTWHCKTTASSVWLVREAERYAWAFTTEPRPAHR